MEREDPLQRIEREERERAERGADLRKTMWILITVACVLAAILAYVWISKALLVKDLKIDKQNLTEQIVALHGITGPMFPSNRKRTYLLRREHTLQVSLL